MPQQPVSSAQCVRTSNILCRATVSTLGMADKPKTHRSPNLPKGSFKCFILACFTFNQHTKPRVTTHHAQHQSQLFQLPGVIRHQIYYYTLELDAPRIIRRKTMGSQRYYEWCIKPLCLFPNDSQDPHVCLKSKTKQHQPGTDLLFTCKRIHSEAYSIMSENAFAAVPLSTLRSPPCPTLNRTLSSFRNVAITYTNAVFHIDQQTKALRHYVYINFAKCYSGVIKMNIPRLIDTLPKPPPQIDWRRNAKIDFLHYRSGRKLFLSCER